MPTPGTVVSGSPPRARPTRTGHAPSRARGASICDHRRMSDQRTALVLGGGGITGIAWEIGLLAGLREAGVDLTTADLVVGTSAGSVVGAQVTGGAELEAMFGRQLEPPAQERVARMSRSNLARYAWAMLVSRGRDEEFRRRVGTVALAAEKAGLTPTEQERLDVIGSRLVGRSGRSGSSPSPPSTRTPASSAPSTAPPGCRCCRRSPPAAPSRACTRRSPSTGSATSTAGCARRERRPRPGLRPARRARPDPARRRADHQRRRAGDRHGGRPRRRRHPGPGRRAAIGRNVLDPAARAPSARAGRAQAAEVAVQVAEAWTG